jgi:cell wall-associated NlpC family hydrolase
MSLPTRPADPGTPRRWMRRASAALAAVVVTAVLASSLPADAGSVYPSKHKVNAAKAAVRGKAAQVKAIQATLARAAAEVEAADNAAESAAEFYNFQMDQLATATRAAKVAQAAADAAARKAGLAQKQIGKLAAEAYMSGGMGNLAVIVGAGGPDQVLDRAAGLQVVSGIRQQTLADASQTKVVAGILQQKAAVALARQKAAAQAAAKAKAAAEAQAAAAAAKKVAVAKQQTALIAQLAQLQRISVKLAKARQAGLAAKRAAEKRRQARLAALRAAQAHNGTGGGGHLSPGGSSSGTAAGGRVAVSYAYAQLGKWYLWGADGPSRFDCSGLTMRAWERAGVYLPHYSVAQYAMTEHVPVSDARPGDLVFFANNTSNPGSIHHVAIYIGGGRMIEAPHTGAQVRISSIWRSGLMAYAGRP